MVLGMAQSVADMLCALGIMCINWNTPPVIFLIHLILFLPLKFAVCLFKDSSEVVQAMIKL